MSDTPEQEGAPRREVIATLVIVVAFVGILGGRPVWRRIMRHPTPERCAAMLDRAAEQQARSYERTPSPAPAPHKLDAPEVRTCVRDLTDDEVECALNAGYIDALERCLPP
ncbi:Hypothetical protein A7982_11395 [Minicystis rosea]|nr:Hypothetical protein A7982_11395 [Minicystis rosea]